MVLLFGLLILFAFYRSNILVSYYTEASPIFGSVDYQLTKKGDLSIGGEYRRTLSEAELEKARNIIAKYADTAGRAGDLSQEPGISSEPLHNHWTVLTNFGNRSFSCITAIHSKEEWGGCIGFTHEMLRLFRAKSAE